jgi:predicted nucleic acid-binding protein
VVFDTNTVLSALLFANGRLAWLREHWRVGDCVPLLSRETAAELSRVLAYPKFQLSANDRHELMADFLPYCEVVEVEKSAQSVAEMRRTSHSSTWLTAARPICWSAAIKTC